MKLSDESLKKAFESQQPPPVKEDKRDMTIKRAVHAFEKNGLDNKKCKGSTSLLRHMGTTFLNIIKTEGVPRMTRTSFATIGAAALAVGLFVTLNNTNHFFGRMEEVSQPVTSQETAASPADSTSLAKQKPLPATVSATEADRTPKGTQETSSPMAFLKTNEVPEKEFREMKAAEVAPPQLAGKAMRNMATAPIQRDFREDHLPQTYQDIGRDNFKSFKENPVHLTQEEPLSTFSIDVDTSSYAFVRRQLNNGILPQKSAVRVEEMINYFHYDYPLPNDRTEPFTPTVAVYPTPWNPATKLLHIGIKGYDLTKQTAPKANLVFLIDVSGSMNSPDKLPLLKNAFGMLVDTLKPDDRVAIVVYAGAAGVVLEPTEVKEKGKIFAALDRLQAGGSTAGGAGITMAYSLAEMNFSANAVNRVMLATDGDFNVGITNPEELKGFIERKRKTGIFLSVLGFGQGNYNDALMQELAQNGNGTAAYIDTLNEARKVLVDEAHSTLFPIAKDVKIQVEFNPSTVHDYRLIGYETRRLNREDFNNDQVDAGEVGAGASVTALYEITPVNAAEKLIDPLRYKSPMPRAREDAKQQGEYAFVKIRYKLPDTKTSLLISKPVSAKQEYSGIDKVTPDIRFAAVVAAFGQLLKGTPYTKEMSYDDLLNLAQTARGQDLFGYRAEFLNLIRLAKSARALER